MVLWIADDIGKRMYTDETTVAVFPMLFPSQSICTYARFLAECHKKRLNQASFVLLCFVLFAFSGLCLVFVVSVFSLSSVLYFLACTNMNDTV